MRDKPFSCLAGATVRERLTLAPLSRRDKVRYLIGEVMVLSVFLSSMFIASWLMRACNG